MQPPAITIHRFASTYLCAGEQDAALRLRDRLDTVVRRSIGDYIDAMGAPLVRAEAGRVWLIRRLEVDCTINASWDDSRIARAWAQALVGALGSELAGTGSGNVLCFDSLPHYLARFINDIASGDAWGKWYYRRFAGLAALPSSAAIRSVLVDEPSDGAAALRALSSHELDRVLEALLPDDAMAVLLSWRDVADNFTLTEAAALAAPVALKSHRYAPEDPRWALAVFVEASRQAAPGGTTLLAVIAALGIRFVRHRLTQARLKPKLPRWTERLGGLQALGKLPPSDLIPPAGHSGAFDDSALYTPFGGAFLLLSLLSELPFPACVENWPALAEIPADRALRALLLAKCLGRAHCLPFLRDPVWAELLELPACSDWQALAQDLRRLGSPVRRRWRQGLEARAAELGGVAAEPKTVRWGQRHWRLASDDSGFWHELVPVAELNGTVETEVDLDYLKAPDELPWGRAWDALLSLAAQQLLRRFARRLPGFALSHCDYLYSNFLALSARVDKQGHRYVVRLSRPPLGLMLNLTGMTRCEYGLPWRPGCSFALFSEEDA